MYIIDGLNIYPRSSKIWGLWNSPFMIL